MDRPSTPPTLASSSRPPPLTLEQLKRVEINRLKAKARLRATQEAEASPSTEPNVNKKRPLTVTSADNTSPTAPGRKDTAPLLRDTRLMGRYLDYDLSKMVDSRGGFLVEDRPGIDEEERKRLKARERERMKQNLDPPMYLDPTLNPKCSECNSMDIDHTFKNIFKVLICNKCKDAHPEKYSLLTKTECKDDYLLTDPELRDEELLPHLLKANPHKATWNNMMLYLRCQVESHAVTKWGSLDALDAEYGRRAEEKKRKKSKKFEEALRDLRKKTREGVWQKRRDEEHIHEFGEVEEDEGGESGSGRQRCKDCGFEIEVEVF
ncbi:hypothetical protein FRB96_004868 [Tulasnella sp. 330]|nr:hypothetical protein FRB96_004868 [Tulasnella sp. 330]KAG8890073.1 hypothetical protein FRB98_001186 [Tulasnella sp. 332]